MPSTLRTSSSRSRETLACVHTRTTDSTDSQTLDTTAVSSFVRLSCHVITVRLEMKQVSSQPLLLPPALASTSTAFAPWHSGGTQPPASVESSMPRAPTVISFSSKALSHAAMVCCRTLCSGQREAAMACRTASTPSRRRCRHRCSSTGACCLVVGWP